MDYSICTFCYGERYYNQTNRLIEGFDKLEEKPDIFIVTDEPESLLKRDYVKVNNIENYNKKYSNYQKNYYDFDFSVKRYSLLFAFENGYDNVILTDTDVLPNYSLYSTSNVMSCFIENSVAGQTTYNFIEEQKTNSELGNRFKFYEKMFEIEFDKKMLNIMPEDCIQFISLAGKKKDNFLKTWSDCIEIKDKYELANKPAGNIDEMCFSALFNGIKLKNNSDKFINILVANHDRWY
jgi:hypothetical protein